MKVLVFGGTRFFGVHLVERLLENGHDVTIATRGLAKDHFGNRVKRLIVERCDSSSLSEIFKDKEYDCICDNICYASNDVKKLLDVAKCKRYVMTSTMSVYPLDDFHIGMKEEEFGPLVYPLKWYERPDAPYDEIKRQAEAALFQKYQNVNAAAVRFPFVIGEEDYTKRLYFYVENVMNETPMYIDNAKASMSFIRAEDAGSFLAWMVENKETGSFNAANSGTVSIEQILHYVEEKTGKKAILLKEDAGQNQAPYNGTPAYCLNTQKAEEKGFHFERLDSFLFNLLDYYIEQVNNQAKTSKKW